MTNPRLDRHSSWRSRSTVNYFIDMQSPTLPEDIERYIWETFADLYPKEVPNCCQVSDQIKKWLQPMLHRVVVAYLYSRWPNIQESASNDLTAYPNYVQHVLLGGTLSQDPDLTKCLNLLPLLPNVKDLAIWWDGSGVVGALLPYCAHLQPERLSISFETLLGPGRGLRGYTRHSIFSRLTHLEVIIDCDDWNDWKDLAELPCLTHLSLTLGSSVEVIEGALAECKHLKILTRVTQGVGLQEQETCRLRPSAVLSYTQTDPRVVEFECGYLADWKAFAFGEPNMWTIAERVVEERLRDKSGSVVDTSTPVDPLL
ncbi:hypothetical protein BDN72DRAFT_843665 [Pluteus cervinus]|uniref:Uncharacterized protein n=1 Tax=Pluteus cervinus TaxID=181527 RepID=A0ACD3ALU0_9AGAR|nr:hypothetical protein BDN72DRAFT_843665 [Pluteus cervinus]